MSETSITLITREEYEAMQQQLEGRIQSLAANGEEIPKKEFKRERVARVFDQAFDMIGGVPRLALWANLNETEFYKLYGRMLPTGTQIDLTGGGKFVVEHVLPPSKLDRLENQDAEQER